MSLAALKKRIKKGTRITLLRHDWTPKAGAIGLERHVVHVQKNGIWLARQIGEPKKEWAWLSWPAPSLIAVHPSGFRICLNPEKNQWMEYAIGD